MDSAQWDERYAASDLVWSVEPNQWVVDVAGPLASGRVLDLAAGEGRNALWLAERGWTATAIDFSPIAIDRARTLAAERLGDDSDRFTGAVGDLLRLRPERGAYDLVLLVYLHVRAADRWLVMRTAAEYLAPGGRLLVVGHHSDNLTEGVGGPQDPSVLYTQDDLIEDLVDTGLEIERAECVVREVQSDDGMREALDVVVVARRAVEA